MFAVNSGGPKNCPGAHQYVPSEWHMLGNVLTTTKGTQWMLMGNDQGGGSCWFLDVEIVWILNMISRLIFR